MFFFYQVLQKWKRSSRQKRHIQIHNTLLIHPDGSFTTVDCTVQTHGNRNDIDTITIRSQHTLLQHIFERYPLQLCKDK